jgi:hypothetical protein
MDIKPNAATLTDRWAGALADAALPVALRHHVRGNSVDVELAVGHAVERALKTGRPAAPEDLVARVADGVYEAALRRGLPGPFLDLRLDLWRALRRTVGS